MYIGYLPTLIDKVDDLRYQTYNTIPLIHYIADQESYRISISVFIQNTPYGCNRTKFRRIMILYDSLI